MNLYSSFFNIISGTRKNLEVAFKPRGGAIVYGIEGSKVVLASLERIKVESDIAFLKPVADNATALLCTMREISEGVDDELAGLALDACGLAFILVNECYRFRRDHKQVPDKLIWGSNELAEYLRDDVYSFVQKKISRDFLNGGFMHAVHDEEIRKFRDKLKLWMGKLGIQTELSIHDKVEAIISQRVLAQNEEAEVPQSSTSKFDPLKHVGDGKRSAEGPLPQIPVSDTRDDRGWKGQIVPTEDVGSNNNETPDRYSLPDEYRKTKKREEGLMVRKAERDRWRRSKQEFCLLPLQKTTTLTRPDERPPRPASVAILGLQAHSSEMVQSSVAGFTSTSKNDQGTDNELALRLQAQLAKEIEEEDEKKAFEIGIMLHHQWEAEDRARSVAGLTSTSKSDEHTDRELALRLQAQLAKEIEEEDEKKALDIAVMLRHQWETEKKARSDKRHLQSNVKVRTPDSVDSRHLKPQTWSALSIHQANQYRHPLSRNRSASPMHSVAPRLRARKTNGEFVSNCTSTEPTCFLYSDQPPRRKFDGL